MYNMMLDSMATDLVKAGVIEATEKDRATEVLGQMWHDRIALVWHLGDVMDRAKENDVELTEDEARAILRSIHRDHDAGIGVNWTVVDTNVAFYTS